MFYVIKYKAVIHLLITINNLFKLKVTLGFKANKVALGFEAIKIVILKTL